MTRVRLLLAVIFTLSLSISAPAAAQTAAAADPRTIVLDALARLDDGNYHYTLNATNLATYTDQKGQVIYSTALFSSVGDVAAAGDYHDTFLLQTGSTFDAARSAPASEVNRVKIGDETYVHLPQSILTLLRLDVDPGWWRYGDLSAQITDQSTRLNLGTLINYPSPTRLSINGDTLASVSENGTQVIDGRELRVYRLALDGLAYIMLQPEGTTLNAWVAYLKTHDLLTNNPTSGSVDLWLSADEGRIYGGTSQIDLLLPLLTLTRDARAGYDIEIKANYTLTIRYPDQPLVVSPPDASLLKH